MSPLFVQPSTLYWTLKWRHRRANGGGVGQIHMSWGVWKRVSLWNFLGGMYNCSSSGTYQLNRIIIIFNHRKMSPASANVSLYYERVCFGWWHRICFRGRKLVTPTWYEQQAVSHHKLVTICGSFPALHYILDSKTSWSTHEIPWRLPNFR